MGAGKGAQPPARRITRKTTLVLKRAKTDDKLKRSASAESGDVVKARPTLPQEELSHSRFVRLPVKEIEHAHACLLDAAKNGFHGMDETMPRGVTVLPVPVGQTPGGNEAFPRAWRRRGEPTRGDALWCIPANGDTSRRMLFLHGGAYTGMSPQDTPYTAAASQLARRTGLAVLAIDYRKAPEHKCPAAVEDAVAALRWLARYGPPQLPSTESACAVRAAATEIFICGDSAGGGLALATALSAPPSMRELLSGITAISAWTDMTASACTYESRVWCSKTRTGDPFDDRSGAISMAEQYLGAFPPKDHRASPIFAPASRLRALPPTFFVVGDYEVSLGDSTTMRQRMLAAGHEDASISIYDRMFHCHPLFADGKCTGRPLRAAVRALDEITAWIARRSRC
eukprot:TRINITY_DN7965_c1_g1_i1.p1 TRINITY_DN7965_c1_g1~~TRINITY_DN7965_c1_g1_i1.p1  ORF type:complete len:413 (-),score=58.06 TRINITY_DN7965_c1_g1_i1:267-1463(-)